MMQFPFISMTEDIQTALHEIEIASKKLRLLPIQKTQLIRISRSGTLRSAIYSAKIEGISVSLVGDQATTQKEVVNICKALEWVERKTSPLIEQDMLTCHALIMNGVEDPAGKFRREQSAIYDSFGNAVYITPVPSDIPTMISTLFDQSQQFSRTAGEIIYIACLVHYYFEKIHPFLDGNGRVGRVMFQYALQQSGLFAMYILPVEEYIDQNRADYYALLEKNTRDVHDFVMFLLKGILWSIDVIMKDITGAPIEKQAQSKLHPRRKEIFETIKDHPFITLNSLSRRFPAIEKRVLGYEVSQLVKHGYVFKYGMTKNACYSTSDAAEA